MSTISDCIGQKNHLYFIGIGGVGMSALAHIMHARGYTVSGSDLQSSKYTELLTSLGCAIALPEALLRNAAPPAGAGLGPRRVRVSGSAPAAANCVCELRCLW